MPLSTESQRRIQAIKTRIEEVGETLGVPHDQAAAIVAVDILEQSHQEKQENRSIVKKVISYAAGLLKS